MPNSGVIIALILIWLAGSLFMHLKRMLAMASLCLQKEQDSFNDKYQRLSAERAQLAQEVSALGKTLEGTVALYNITRHICKSLDKDKVFLFFKEELARYIDIADCKFITQAEDLSSYPGYTAVPLNIDKEKAGFLLASGIKEEDKEKFNILAQQFLLGLKRALLYEKVQELAITDALTGAFSRRYCLERLNDEIQRCKNMKLNFSLLMIDIDHFKECNDKYGHLVGDAVLSEVAGVIKENIRQIDLMGRYGGEEFLVILTETAGQEAGLASERIRQSIESRRIRVYDEDLKVTISIGISVFPAHAKNPFELINKADRAMYTAKNTGRNKVCVYRPA